MEDFIEKDNTGEVKVYKRPPSLTILCIFTFIGSGSAAFANLYFAAFYNIIPQIYANPAKATGNVLGKDIFKSFESEFKLMLEMLNTIPRDFFTISFILSAVSLFGAILMWKLKKIGFHFYTASQLFILLTSMYYLGINQSYNSTFFTISFILLYAMNLRFMKK